MPDQRRFRKKLAASLGYIERSCISFDEGYYDEGIRIATVVRVLIHDTRSSSTSLLSHLNVKDSISLLSTCEWQDSIDGLLVFDGLMRTRIDIDKGKSTVGFEPKLDKTMVKFPLPVDRWWDQWVTVVAKGSGLTRRDLVLDAANKDGGAHVDHTLTPEYEKLIDDHWYLATTKGGVETKVPFTEMHLLMLRQVGYELLNSPELTRLAG